MDSERRYSGNAVDSDIDFGPNVAQIAVVEEQSIFVVVIAIRESICFFFIRSTEIGDVDGGEKERAAADSEIAQHPVIGIRNNESAEYDQKLRVRGQSERAADRCFEAEDGVLSLQPALDGDD